MGLFNRKNKQQTKNEFRYNHKTKHMNYVFEEDGTDYHSLGLTHEKTTRDKKKKKRQNMPLDKNPQKNRKEKSYIRYGVITQDKKTYGKKDKRFEFSEEDKPKVKSKIRNYKNNRRKTK